MTPVCTDTPKSARKPTPEATLKKVCGKQKSQQPADACHSHRDQNEQGPFGRAKHGVENDEDEQDGDRNDHQQSGFGSHLAFVFSHPFEVIASRQVHILVDLGYGFPDGGPQVPVTHLEPDGNIA